MLAGLSTRRYPAGLEPVGNVEARATSRSSVSRRFVEGTKRKLAEIFGRDLSTLDLLAIFIDGKVVADHCILVALGVDGEGHKHRRSSGNPHRHPHGPQPEPASDLQVHQPYRVEDLRW